MIDAQTAGSVRLVRAKLADHRTSDDALNIPIYRLNRVVYSRYVFGGGPDFLSVEQVAERLGLHVRTVRAYLRSGRLKGVRIGKQYRIARENLDTLTGRSGAFEPVRRTRHIDVSSIVQVDAISPDSASRLTNMLMAAAKAPREEDHALRIDTTYDEERARLKVFISGSPETTVSMIGLVETLAERRDK